MSGKIKLKLVEVIAHSEYYWRWLTELEYWSPSTYVINYYSQGNDLYHEMIEGGVISLKDKSSKVPNTK